MRAWEITGGWEVFKVRDINQTALNVLLSETEQMNILSKGRFLFNFC